MSVFLDRLRQLNIALPTPPQPVGSYLPVAVEGNLLFTSGQLPMRGGVLLAVGQVPGRCAPEQAHLAARQCVVNALAAIRQFDPSVFDRLAGVVRVGVFVSSDSSFTQQAGVANGASDFLVEIFGHVGRHVRTSVGVPCLPLDAAVEIDIVFRLTPEP